ncbi:MAG: helix-turn-helix domain-containing GNAT family N-acetyltransferase [Candidatus Dormiibacterota bacterium]
MDAAMVAQVRRFNRVVTQRVGALDERFLARDRPLGAARVLWEIGADERDVRSLRAQLGLDSGYMSRLLRSLETAGMITVAISESDRRVRTVWLTAAGLAERAMLDRRSDSLASSLLAPLDPAQRARLVGAMAVVERLMTAGMVEISITDPVEPDAQHCLSAYVAELDSRFATGFDPARSISAVEDELRPPAGLFMLASLHGNPVGCGALKFHGNEPAELKRMWVDVSARGLGIGRRLLALLEAQAAQRGVTLIRLETNESLVEAVALYRSAGYAEVAAFSADPYAHHWFEKQIADHAVARTAEGSDEGRPRR